jgi:hypothetical protein
MPRGRKPKYQEFLLTLREATGLSGVMFAQACGKKPANWGQYLAGRRHPGLGTIKAAIHSLRDSWPVYMVMELEPIPGSLAKLRERPGIYAFYGSSGEVLYVGQATNLRVEVNQALNRRVNSVVRLGPKISKKAHPKYRPMAALISAYEVPAARLRHNLEALLLRMFPNELHNNKMGNFRKTPWGRSGDPRPKP